MCVCVLSDIPWYYFHHAVSHIIPGTNFSLLQVHLGSYQVRSSETILRVSRDVSLLSEKKKSPRVGIDDRNRLPHSFQMS